MFDTAKVLYDHQKDPNPSFDSSELLRELDVGRAAGSPMSFGPIPGLTREQHAARGIYLAQYSDGDRFPKGESIEDLAVYARTALEKLVLPYVRQAAKEGKASIHVTIISHGLCISESISELHQLGWEERRKHGLGVQ